MINTDYLYTSIYSKIEDFLPEPNSTYYYGHSPEKRSYIADEIIARNPNNIKFVEITEIDNDLIYEKITDQRYSLRSSKGINQLLLRFVAETIYIDVTGLDNRICASLINNAIKAIGQSDVKYLKIVYAEPESYNIKQFKSEGVFNDLSEKIDGIMPLPGFATIFPEDIDNTQLVALLGFEGGRFAHILESIQPPRDNVIPVVGVPGFRLEYPYFAYWGNRRPLDETDTWRQIKYAAANSFVDIYILLSNILRKNPDSKIKLAPIGTKPHAIGAMLFAIKHPKNVELVYDNPKRKKERTEGVGQIVECFVSKLIDEI